MVHMKATHAVQEQIVGQKKVVQICFMEHGMKSLLILCPELTAKTMLSIDQFQTDSYNHVTVEFSGQISSMLWRELLRVPVLSIQ